MGIREYAVNLLAATLGVSSPLGKGIAGAPQGGTTQSSNDLPAEWLTSTYAPGWPIQPIERPEDTIIPREIDYPLSVNATLQPRTAYGLMPFAALKEAYESVAEVRLPVATLLREMMIFKPHLVDKDDGEIEGHDFDWLCHSPDRVSSWDVWMTRFLKSTQIYDAGAFFYQKDHDNISGVRYVDGSTLFIMVDEHGQMPHPKQVSSDPEVQKRFVQKAMEWAKQGKTLPKTTPAFAQIIKGTPFGWYDTDQIWYKPRSRRVDSPYGETAIEQAWAWILICANITGFELAHYREGNMPEGWLNAPEGWTLERIAAYEKAFNDRMSAGPTERRRTRLVPYGMAWTSTKPPDFPQALYDQAAHTISLFFGVPPSEYGKVPGQGLGGAGFEDAMQSSLFRMGLMPNKTFVEGAMNEVLQRAGVDDAWFELGYPTDEMSPAKQKESIIRLFTSGLMTFNAALSQLGQDRIEGGDVHVIIQNGQVLVLEDAIKSGGTPPPGTPPGNPLASTPPADGTPVATEPERTEPATQGDFDVAIKMIREAKLNYENKKYFIPPIKKSSAPGTVIPKHPKDQHNRYFAGKSRIDDSQAKRIAAEVGFDVTQVSLEEFRRGIEEELAEHPTLSSDENVYGHLVADHLRENPEYYKGGPGSGRYPSGSGGRKGSKGKKAKLELTPGGYQGKYAMQVEKMVDLSNTDNPADYKSQDEYILDKDGKMYGSAGHYEAINEVKGKSFLRGVTSEEEAKTKFVNDGGVRVEHNPSYEYGKRNTVIQTKNVDTATLKQIQKLYDTDKLDIPADGTFFWGGADPTGTNGLEGFASELLSAKFVVSNGLGGSSLKSLAGYNDFTKSLDSDGVMVALDIPDDIGRKLQEACKGSLPEGSEFLPVNEMHVTLFYPGALDEIEFDKAKLLAAVKEFCRTHAPLVGVIGGVATFNGDEERRPLVALFDCPDLPQFRQDLVESLHQSGIEEVGDIKHGFIPHITLAYVPANAEIKEVKIEPLPLTFKEMTVAWSGQWHYLPLQASKNIQKVDVAGLLAKHCGVCEEDDAYYGAPVAREVQFNLPDRAGVEVVSMMPEGLSARPGLWKPEGDENENLQYRIGGQEYPREEAAYLLDRAFNFFLVPVAYVASVNDEHGVVMHYSKNTTPNKAVGEYAPVWQERAGVLDFIMGHTDRDAGSFRTHPDEPDRPVFIHNGLSFPVEDIPPFSPFVDNMRGKSISEETKRFLYVGIVDMAVWDDIAHLVGIEASAKALARANVVVSLGMIPADIDTITPLPDEVTEIK